MLRWLVESFIPHLKCERTGRHKMRTLHFEGYQYPSKWFRGVADRVRVQVPKCVRCDWMPPRGNERWVVLERTTLHGLTLEDDRWAKLRRDGVIRTAQRYVGEAWEEPLAQQQETT